MPEPLKLALFGQPVTHSLSPGIHNAFARQLDITVDYEAVTAGPDDFAEAWQAFVASGGRGANFTMPLKNVALAIADDLHESARQAGAANTLVRREGGWQAHNTDGWGLLADLDRLQISLQGATVLILGAGGAVAGILGPLLSRQPGQLIIANRTLSKAQGLCRKHTGQPLQAIEWQEIHQLQGIDLLINATALGHQGTAPQLPAAGMEPCGRVYDLNYGKAAAPLGEVCERRNLAYSSGLGMLVAQAARSFEIWTGQMPDWSAVLTTLCSDS